MNINMKTVKLKFLHRALVLVNAYKCAKFQLPSSISYGVENRSDQTFCILLIKDVLSVIESANLHRRQNLKRKWSGFEFGFSD